MMRQRIIAVIGAALMVLVACGNDQSAEGVAAGGFPMTVQTCDRTITFERPPERVLTQGSEAAVFVAAAGAADRIVARNSEYGSPLGPYEGVLRDIPMVGETDDKDLSREAIVAQNPDLVINRGLEDDLPSDALSSAGIENFVVSGRCTLNQSGIVANGSFDQIYSDIETLGRIFGTEDTATTAVADLRERVTAVQEQATSLPEDSTAAAIAIAGKVVYGYGNQATLQSQMGKLGLRNVFADQDTRFFEPSLEEYINRDPDVLIVLTYAGSLDEQAVVALPELANLRAVREGRVLSLHFGLTAADPLAVEGLEQLAEQLRQVSR